MQQQALHRSRAHVEVDPELERQLCDVAEDQLVEAVLVLRAAEPAQRGPNDVAALIERARARAPASPIEWNFLPRLGMLIVRGCPRAIRQLLAEPDVELASANHLETTTS